ncbi:Transcription factor gsfR2 [Fusarium oxysporum f. sp. albedinis]|nr:Transcription factor gsfR2 [Fusarium oxysporum f. sp. albedinis]
MATVEVNGILNSLAQRYNESQFQMPPDCPSGQGEFIPATALEATSGPLTPPEQENSPSDQQTPSKSISLPAADVQLRSASSDSKNRKRRGAAPSNQAHARESHNLVEKHYRARLKTQFERLLAVLPAAEALSLADRDTAANLGQVLSRGQVLDMARNHILELEGKLEVILNKRRGGYYVS